MALGHHEIGDLQLARARRRADHHMAEQRAVSDVAFMLVGEFLHHLGAPLGIGAVILGDDLHRAAIDAAGFVDYPRGGIRHPLVPAPVGCADTGAVHLKADPDRLIRATGPSHARHARKRCCRPRSAQCGSPLQHITARQRAVHRFPLHGSVSLHIAGLLIPVQAQD